MRSRVSLLLPATALLALAAGCGGYTVKVNAYLDREHLPDGFKPSASFAVLTGETARGEAVEEKVSKESSRHPHGLAEAKGPLARELDDKIEALLRQRGYQRTSVEKADYYFVFFYGMGPGQEKVGYEPVYTPVDYGIGYYGPYGAWGYPGPYYPGGYYGYGATTQYVPYTYTVYEKWLLLDVIDAAEFRKTKNANVVWRARATSTGEQNDLRDALNFLLVAGFEYFGRDTGHSVEMWMGDDDGRVKNLIKSAQDTGPSGH